VKLLLLPNLLLILACLPLTAKAAQQYSFHITDQKPQPRENFVQGLQILDGYLYVSTGRYGKSQLLRYHFADGRLDKANKVHPRIFAEGLTVFGDKVYQLTWRNKMVLVYSRDDLKAHHWFSVPGEGWGLTNDGEMLIYSDGSAQLHYISPRTEKIERSLTVTENGQAVTRLNELEWVDSKIWANVWQTDRIVIIDPTTGEVTASINLQGLLPADERRKGTGVLNGIARDPADGSVWVTGKRWPWLYQIELLPLPAKTEEAQPNAISR
jgi:glutamine cyclotransferase